MLYIVLASILLLLTAVAVGAFFLMRRHNAKVTSRYDKLPAAGALIVALVLALLFGGVTAAFSATTVDSRAVGIQTSFGRYQDTLENGFQFTAPWSSVEQFSTLNQTLKLEGDNAVPVSFSGGSSGSADVTVRWATTAKGAEEQWKQYRTFENVRDQLVEPESRNAFRTEFSNYSPVEAIDGATLNGITSKVNDALKATLEKSGINVVSIQVTKVTLGDRAQNALDRIVEANANTDRATAEQERARIEAETAKIRQESQTPQALQRYCLEVLNSWSVASNGPVPATMNCNFGESGQTPVIVNP